MKRLISYLLLLLLVSCGTITVERGVHCYNHRICEGEHYNYHRVRRATGFYAEQVTIIRVRPGYIRYRTHDGHEYEEHSKYFYNNAYNDEGNHPNNGKHLGQKKHGKY